MQRKTIHRLTSGDEEMQWVGWSPDGKWILHGSVFAYGEGTQYSIYAAEITGSRILPFGSASEFHWLNSHAFVEYESQNVIGDYNLRLVDVDTDKIIKIWNGSFHDYTVDPAGNWLIMYSDSSVMPPATEKPNFIPGLQLINLNSLTIIQNPDLLPNPPDTFLRTTDGNVVALPEPAKPYGELIFASPNTKYWSVVVSQDVKIYDQNLTLVRENSVPLRSAKLPDVQWSPDSFNLFLVYGSAIFSMRIADGDIRLVETNLIDNYGTTYTWINGQ